MPALCVIYKMPINFGQNRVIVNNTKHEIRVDHLFNENALTLGSDGFTDFLRWSEKWDELVIHSGSPVDRMRDLDLDFKVFSTRASKCLSRAVAEV